MDNSKTYKSSYKQPLSGKIWHGIVVDIDDPLKIGRAKVRVFGKHDQRKNIDDKGQYPDSPLSLEDYLNEDNFILPNRALHWCFQVGSLVFGGGENPGSGSFSTPKLGSLVEVTFANDDLGSGEYRSVKKFNAKMIEKILSDEDYINASVTVFDEDEDYWMLYTKTIGLQIYHKGSQIVIRPDSSIFIEHKDTESMIDLTGPDIKIVANRDIDITSQNRITNNSRIVKINGENTYVGTHPIYSMLLGEPTWKLLKALAVIIDGKNAPTPGVASAAVDAAEKAALSRSVKVSM